MFRGLSKGDQTLGVYEIFVGYPDYLAGNHKYTY